MADSYMFSGRHSTINFDLKNPKVFFCLHLTIFEIAVFESLNCPPSEMTDLTIIQSLLERIQICWKTEKSAGDERFFFLKSYSVVNLLYINIYCLAVQNINMHLFKLFTFSQNSHFQETLITLT